MTRMGIVLEFGEPFCRLGGSTVTVPGPKGATGMTVKEALAAAGLSVNDLDGTLDPDLSAFVTVNGKALLPDDRFSVRVRDGDVVSFQLMLSGG